ncbi:hypothetical protein HKD37_02G004959 [Glycine soja]
MGWDTWWVKRVDMMVLVCLHGKVDNDPMLFSNLQLLLMVDWSNRSGFLCFNNVLPFDMTHKNNKYNYHLMKQVRHITMKNKHPKQVTTDEDGAMRKKAIHSNFNLDEFEDFWIKMVEKHGLTTNEVLKDILKLTAKYEKLEEPIDTKNSSLKHLHDLIRVKIKGALKKRNNGIKRSGYCSNCSSTKQHVRTCLMHDGANDKIMNGDQLCHSKSSRFNMSTDSEMR